MLTESENKRRCDLIDKSIHAFLHWWEAEELKSLNRRMLEHRKQHAPLPIAEAEETLRKLREAARNSGSEGSSSKGEQE